MKKVIALLMILAVNACALPANAAAKKSKTDVKKQIQQYNAIAKEKSKQSKTLLSQLSRLKQDAGNSQEKIVALEQENAKLASSVKELNKKIEAVQVSISITLETLKGRLVDIYKYTPDEQSLSIILSAYNPHDAVNTAYMLNKFAHQDVMLLQELMKKEKELVDARTQLEANTKKLSRQTDELKKKRAEYDTAVKKTDTLLRSVQSEQKKAENAARELQNAQKAVGSKINTLMKQKNTAKTKKPVGGSKSTVPVKAATKTTSSVKSLSWPVNGTVSMQYGSRVHPTFKTKIFNSGIDIKAASGTPVKAAGAGEVLYQGWLRGFGQVVIIDHGGDISTVYAHLGGTSVREGASVKAGTVIGKVGNTGTDSEYGLHFEVRKNGSAVNPMNFLR